MTSAGVRKLHNMIVANSISSSGPTNIVDVDTSKEAIEHLLKTVDIFDVLEGHRESCFTLAIKFHNERIINIFLKYFSQPVIDKRIQALRKERLDFSRPAFGKHSPTCNMNVLQYVFKYGDIDTFRECCNFIGDKQKVKDLMNAPIKREKRDKDGEVISSNESSVWEEALLAITLQRVAFDPSETLNDKKYDQETIKYLTKFFSSWMLNSEVDSIDKTPDIIDEWKKYAEEHNKKFPDKTPLPLDNPVLHEPIEFIVDPYYQFKVPTTRQMIDLQLTGTSSVNVLDLVKYLALDASDEDNISCWKEIPNVLSMLDDQKNVLIGKLGETSEGLKSLTVTFDNNAVGNQTKRIHAKMIFNFKNLYASLKEMKQEMELSINHEVQTRLRAHSTKIEKIDNTVKQIVEVKRNAYADDDSKSDVAKACYRKLCNKALTHAQGRLLAADGLFTANTTTDAAKYAQVGGLALKTIADLIPVQGATIIPTIYGIGMKYITGKFSTTQSEGVASASIDVNLPLLLVELSEALTEILMQLTDGLNLDDDQKYAFLMNKNGIVEKTAEAISKRLDGIHAELKEHGGNLTKEQLREFLMVDALKHINKATTDALKHSHEGPKVMFSPGHRPGSQSSLKSNKSSGTDETSKTTDSRKSGRPPCAIS